MQPNRRYAKVPTKLNTGPNMRKILAQFENTSGPNARPKQQAPSRPVADPQAREPTSPNPEPEPEPELEPEPEPGAGPEPEPGP